MRYEKKRKNSIVNSLFDIALVPEVLKPVPKRNTTESNQDPIRHDRKKCVKRSDVEKSRNP